MVYLIGKVGLRCGLVNNLFLVYPMFNGWESVFLTFPSHVFSSSAFFLSFSFFFFLVLKFCSGAIDLYIGFLQGNSQRVREWVFLEMMQKIQIFQ